MTKEKKRPVDLDFWEWLNVVAEKSDWFPEPTEHQKRLWDFFSGQSTEDVKLVIASPRRTRTYQLIGARMLTKPWENHRGGHVEIEIGDDIKSEPCKTELVRFDGQVQVHVDDLVETYPEGCEVIKVVAEKAEAEKEQMIDYILQRQERGAGQSVSVQKTPLSPDVIPNQSASLPIKAPPYEYRETAAVLLGVSPDQIGPLSEPVDIEDCVEPSIFSDEAMAESKKIGDWHKAMHGDDDFGSEEDNEPSLLTTKFTGEVPTDEWNKSFTMSGDVNAAELPEEKARRLASEAYHDHPSNPVHCLVRYEEGLDEEPGHCPCENNWRDFLEGEDDE